MARIRSIHPCVCMSEDAGSLSDGAERTMMRLLTHTDDHGRGQDRPTMIASMLYPDMPEKDGPLIDGHMAEMAKVNIIARYTVAGKRFYQFVAWEDYQSPQRPTKSRIPPLEEADDTPPLHVPEASDTPPLHVASGGEWSGVEWSGVDPPGGVANATTLLDKVAAWLSTDHGWTCEEQPNLHLLYDAVAREALPRLGDPKRHNVAMGLVCEYAERVNGEKIPADHRTRIGRLLKAHLAEHVLYGVAQSLDWGAGLSGDHARDPDAWLNYVTVVVISREKEQA